MSSAGEEGVVAEEGVEEKRRTTEMAAGDGGQNEEVDITHTHTHTYIYIK